ncbi:MAG: 16S rRNA (guanine(966)-N(2))-methyltransferase RsmD [Gammaproteobacteria bacterium]
MAANEVRIIGGNWRGRKLRFPSVPGLRPTLGRVRETLFNWLQADVSGRHVLDCFAGSGALGFEALSRGAASATLIEAHRSAAAALRDNAERLGVALRPIGAAAARSVDGAVLTVVCSPIERFLDRARPDGSRWDLVFLDPPFGSALLAETLALLRAHPALAEQALIYVETGKAAPLEFPGFDVLRETTAGDTRGGLLCLASPNSDR